MNDYYDAGGGCFEENCLVRMHDNTLKKIKYLKKEDLIKNSFNGSVSKVVLVLKIKCTNKKCCLV